ncbi:unnamed protein product [Gongylonema pulchrum]|uniref:MFS domain-containing protein n=1 Tax=Gongylonema pulchrum TaxID=637853 RepID=A0A183DNG4_9BILA|nr:unnamed protein product [Gongylonema pulchrum]
MGINETDSRTAEIPIISQLSTSMSTAKQSFNSNQGEECNQKQCSSKAPRGKQWPTPKLLITGIFVVLGGGFNFGFQLSVINPMAKPLQRHLSHSLESRYDVYFSEISIRILWSSIAGILFVGAIIGATVMPAVVCRIGSRWSFVLTGSALNTISERFANIMALFLDCISNELQFVRFDFY